MLPLSMVSIVASADTVRSPTKRTVTSSREPFHDASHRAMESPPAELARGPRRPAHATNSSYVIIMTRRVHRATASPRTRCDAPISESISPTLGPARSTVQSETTPVDRTTPAHVAEVARPALRPGVRRARAAASP
jgi:hypothetical protein